MTPTPQVILTKKTQQETNRQARGKLKHKYSRKTQEDPKKTELRRKYQSKRSREDLSYPKEVTLKLGCRMSIFESRDQVDKAKKRIPIS